MAEAAQEPAVLSVNAQIANHVVRLTAEHTGRGPTRARTTISDGLVTVVLEDILTKGEHSLVRNGKSEDVLRTRSAYQQMMREELTEGIERLLGRKVTAFLSANHVDPDVAIEAFVLGDPI